MLERITNENGNVFEYDPDEIQIFSIPQNFQKYYGTEVMFKNKEVIGLVMGFGVWDGYHRPWGLNPCDLKGWLEMYKLWYNKAHQSFRHNRFPDYEGSDDPFEIALDVAMTLWSPDDSTQDIKDDIGDDAWWALTVRDFLSQDPDNIKLYRSHGLPPNWLIAVFVKEIINMELKTVVDINGFHYDWIGKAESLELTTSST